MFKDPRKNNDIKCRGLGVVWMKREKYNYYPLSLFVT